MSDTDSDVYLCEVWYFCTVCVCFVLFLIDVTAVRRSCRPGMKEIKQYDYITAFHLACWSPVEELQPCAADVDSGLCGVLNVCH